jgi:predicted lipid carrier protein YhbT
VPGAGADPAVTFRLPVSDFARLVAEEVDPQELLFSGRFTVEGDLHVALRVREMFGGGSQF